MTELVIKLEDETKLNALLRLLRQFIESEGVDLAIESLERHPLNQSQHPELDWDRWNDLMNREKIRPGQPFMDPREEEEWIARETKTA